jgi:hypothetical protein
MRSALGVAEVQFRQGLEDVGVLSSVLVSGVDRLSELLVSLWPLESLLGYHCLVLESSDDADFVEI